MDQAWALLVVGGGACAAYLIYGFLEFPITSPPGNLIDAMLEAEEPSPGSGRWTNAVERRRWYERRETSDVWEGKLRGLPHHGSILNRRSLLKIRGGSGETATSYLRRIAYEGAGRRWPQGMPAKVQLQIEHKLDLIKDLKYEHYFLTVADIVAFARSGHILCQGRGSAANSVVCYCIGVTEVDPARMSVLFERFKQLEPAFSRLR